MDFGVFLFTYCPPSPGGLFLCPETAMITFKSVADLHKLSRSDPARTVIQDILADFPRDPDTHGYVVLVQPGDTRIDLPEIKGTISEMSFDGVAKQDGHYHAVYLTNNEFALEFVIPDADWLGADLRDSLDAQISASYLKEHPF